MLTQVGCIALVAAVALTFTPAAHAQRGLFRGGANNYGGYMPGFNYGYGPNSGYGRGLGYGGYGYNMYPGLNTYQYGYSNVPFNSNYSPGYYQTPGYNYSSPNMNYGSTNVVTPNYQMSPGYQMTPGYQTVPNYQMNPGGMTGMVGSPQAQSMSNAAMITVIVSPDAQLWIDNQQSTQTGPQRQIVTPATLEPGKTYHYTLKAQWTENGQPVTREKSVDFQAGGQVTVDFTKPQQ